MSAESKNYKRYGSRFKARRRAVDLLFEAEFRDEDPVAMVEDRIVLSRDPDTEVPHIPEYTQAIVAGVAENLDSVDQAIASHLSSDWRLDRLPAVDRQVLRVAAWEIIHNPEVPPRVALVEGIELAAIYSHDKAPGYVNAVLDGIVNDPRHASSEEEKKEEEDSSSS